MATNGEKLLVTRVLRVFQGVPDQITVFDMGANVGSWTSQFLREAHALGMQERVTIHAFEPLPTTFRALKEHVSCASGSQVRLVQMAHSSRPGSVPMFVIGATAGTNSLHPDPASVPFRSVLVEATTADLYVEANGIEFIHMVKCDAEGHDMEVILGARRLFDERRVLVWQFEYNHRWVAGRHFLRDAFEFATEVDYSVGKVTQDGIEIYDAWPLELERFFEGNYVLISRHVLAQLHVCHGGFDAYGTWVARA